MSNQDSYYEYVQRLYSNLSVNNLPPPGEPYIEEISSSQMISITDKQSDPLGYIIWGFKRFDPKGNVKKYIAKSAGFDNCNVLPVVDKKGRYCGLPISRKILREVKRNNGIQPTRWALWYWMRPDVPEGFLLTPLFDEVIEPSSGMIVRGRTIHLGEPLDWYSDWCRKYDPNQYYFVEHNTGRRLFAECVNLKPDYKKTPWVRIPSIAFKSSVHDVAEAASQKWERRRSNRQYVTSKTKPQSTPERIKPVFTCLYDEIGTILFVRRRYFPYIESTGFPETMNLNIYSCADYERKKRKTDVSL